MASLQIPDLDSKTMTLLRQWAADHSRTLEDEARIVLQRIVSEAEGVLSGRGVPANGGGSKIMSEAEQSRGALSLQPMILSDEDAALMDEAWENGLARPTMPIVPLPQYEG